MRLEFLLPLQRESWHCTAVGLPLPESKKRLQIVFGLQLFSDSNDQNKKMVKVQVTHLFVSLWWWRWPIPKIELL